VLGERAVARGPVPGMYGDAPALVQDLNTRGRHARLESLADEGVRHRVEALVDLDVIVDAGLHMAPLGVLVGLGGQRAHRRAVEALEELAAAAG